MIHNEFSPSLYTDLPFEAESGSIHSAQIILYFKTFSEDFTRKLLSKSSKKSQGIHDLEQIEGSVFAHSSEICVVRG